MLGGNLDQYSLSVQSKSQKRMSDRMPGKKREGGQTGNNTRGCDPEGTCLPSDQQRGCAHGPQTPMTGQVQGAKTQRDWSSISSGGSTALVQ